MPGRRALLALGAAAAAGRAEAAVMDATWQDPARPDRPIPVKLRLPATRAPAPLVVISHGLGGSREGLGYLGAALAEAGFVALHVQHPGTDAALWQGRGAEGRQAMMAAVVDVRAAVARLRDGVFVLDEVARRNAARGDPLQGRVDLARIAVAGHSYGAWTVQHLIGQRLPGQVPNLVLPDRRIRAGIALSPIIPKGLPPRVAFGGVAAPLLSVTGTRDGGFIDQTTPEQREIPFRTISGVPQALLVLEGATHMAFADEGLAGARWADDSYHRRTLAVALLFLRATLLEDAAARRSLAEHAPGLLAPGDRLEVKDWPATARP